MAKIGISTFRKKIPEHVAVISVIQILDANYNLYQLSMSSQARAFWMRFPIVAHHTNISVLWVELNVSVKWDKSTV